MCFHGSFGHQEAPIQDLKSLCFHNWLESHCCEFPNIVNINQQAGFCDFENFVIWIHL
jgi:hypothetical protein